MTHIDMIVRNALTDFTNDLFQRSWPGKEREAVSLFAFGYLVKQCAAGTDLFDPAQIGLEVRVPKPEGQGIKREVCKDLVIWPKPAATWLDDAGPIAVLEWKANESQVSARDIKWLTAFSKGRPKFVGYAICLDLEKRNFRLKCVRVQEEEVQPDWLLL